MTIAAILTSLLAFIIIGFLTLGKESDRNSVKTMNLLSQNAEKTADARLNNLKTAVDMTAHIAGNSLAAVNLKDFGVTAAAVDKTGRSPEQIKQLDEEYAKKAAERPNKKQGKKPAASSDNYEKRSYDRDYLEKVIRLKREE